jgi:hypothetical protein
MRGVDRKLGQEGGSDSRQGGLLPWSIGIIKATTECTFATRFVTAPSAP